MALQNSNSGWGVGGFGAGTWGNPPVFMQPLGYYLNLLTSEYQGSAHLRSWLTACLRKLDNVTTCLANFTPAFDLDDAHGVQLDIIGQIVGASRNVPFQPSGGVSPVLDDATYRLFIKATVAANQWDGTISSLQTIWQTLFPGGRITIVDSQDMSATIFLTGVFSSIVNDLVLNGLIVPRPEGVLYNYVFTTLPAFGFDAQNDLIAGFDTGHWS